MIWSCSAISRSPQDYDAVLFDLDGAQTRTAKVHAAAWKKLFDGFLEQRASQSGEPFVPFDVVADYLRYVDRKPRYESVADFLESRGIELPLGESEDGHDVQSVRAQVSARVLRCATIYLTRQSGSFFELIGRRYALLVWGYALAWFVFNGAFKVWVEGLLWPDTAGHTRHLQCVHTSLYKSECPPPAKRTVNA